MISRIKSNIKGILFFLTVSVLIQSIVMIGSDVYADRMSGPTEADLGHFYVVLKIFKESCGRYPLTKEGLKAIKTPPRKLKCKQYPKQVGDIQVMDDYGEPLKYISDGKTYRLEASHGYFLTEKSPQQVKQVCS